MLLNSNGLPNNELRFAFRELVLELPDIAWEEGGPARKYSAKNHDLGVLAKRGFHEPDLYHGLTTVVLEDPCFLKEAFWNSTHPDFHARGGVNAKTTYMTTRNALVREFFGKGLDGAWCVNSTSSLHGGLGTLGLDRDRIHHVSLFDRLAGDDLKRMVFELQTRTLPLDKTFQTALRRLLKGHLQNRPQPLADCLALLESADILVVNGGNPDFVNFVLREFAIAFTERMVARVRNGSLVYLGRSAGAMVGSADAGVTFEPSPNLLAALLHKDTKGLGLVGRCAIRPHFKLLWDLTSNTYGLMKNLTVLRLPDGEGLQCFNLTCRILGATSHLGESTFAGPDDVRLLRLAGVFAAN